jgi:hypothetical protein
MSLNNLKMESCRSTKFFFLLEDGKCTSCKELENELEDEFHLILESSCFEDIFMKAINEETFLMSLYIYIRVLRKDFS